MYSSEHVWLKLKIFDDRVFLDSMSITNSCGGYLYIFLSVGVRLSWCDIKITQVKRVQYNTAPHKITPWQQSLN